MTEGEKDHPSKLQPVPAIRRLADALRHSSLSIRSFQEFEVALRQLPEDGQLSGEQLNLLRRIVSVHSQEIQDVQAILDEIVPGASSVTPIARTPERSLEYPFLLMIERVELQRHRPEAEIILRMGAFANVLSTIVRRYPLVGNRRVDRRDRLHLSITAAAYVDECRLMMNRRHDGLGWELALLGLQAGRAQPPGVTVTELRSLLAKESAFGEKVARVRDKFAFHFDSDPFLKWLTNQDGYEAMVMYAINGADQAREIVFDASAKCVAAAFQELEEPGFAKQLATTINAIPHLVDLIIQGFARKYGLQIGPPTRELKFAGEGTEY